MNSEKANLPTTHCHPKLTTNLPNILPQFFHGNNQLTKNCPFPYFRFP